jgi:Protein of unknown function (DUF2442)
VIKILNSKNIDEFVLEITFSNGDEGHFSGHDYLALRQGLLLDALRQPDFFARHFVDAGALCWPNGLELSATRVHELCNMTVT